MPLGDGDVTMHGLQKWCEKKYEKLGWMILAVHKGHDEKVQCYIKGVERLCTSIKAKISTMTDDYHKQELTIVYKKAMFLKAHIVEILSLPSLKADIVQVGGAKKMIVKKGSRKGSKKSSKKY